MVEWGFMGAQAFCECGMTVVSFWLFMNFNDLQLTNDNNSFNNSHDHNNILQYFKILYNI